MEKDKEVIIPEVNEDAELDKSLEESLPAVKAGNVQEVKTPVEPEAKKEETPIEPKEGEASEPPVVEVEKKDELRIPNKGKFESDEAYEKRVELFDKVKRRKAAKTPELKQKLSEEIEKTKSQLKTLNGADKFINPLNEKTEIVPKEEVDPAKKADIERLKELGGVTKDEIEQILQKDRLAKEVSSSLDKFVNRYPELKDDDMREVFFDFVDQNYNWQGKSGKDFVTILELARENMFKPSETIQERVLKGANVQEKVNAMQFPGGSVVKNSYSPETRKSLDEMMATGMSEEKALELLSD